MKDENNGLREIKRHTRNGGKKFEGRNKMHQEEIKCIKGK